MARILMVEDDPRSAALVAEFLRMNGLTVEVHATGGGVVERVRAAPPDLLLLDLLLPEEDGLSLCRRVRAFYRGPILLWSARGEEVDQIVGLELGADDYLPKPASPRLLLARVRALLRRQEVKGDRVVVGDLVIDAAHRVARVQGTAAVLTTAEFDLLWALAQSPGRVQTRDELFLTLRGRPYDGLDRSIDMRISTLRKALSQADPLGRDWVLTVRGAGYQLVGG